MAERLVRPFTEQELERAVKSLSSNKAPGPDGYPGEFYKRFWPHLKRDLFQAVQYFYWNAKMPISWGSTHVALIPKIKNPRSLKEYRPISICDTKYKILSKMLVSRLKEVLSHIIGREQGAFIPGRSIHAHLLLVQDMMHSLRQRSGRHALMAVKVDLASAYDSEEWEALFHTLLCFDKFKELDFCMDISSWEYLNRKTPIDSFCVDHAPPTSTDGDSNVY
ncbi:hypothetical protein QJS10_CPB21g01596 [Acorus calamus]|uniref:Reverse transcriptase domain-containing protein n=1 Tax=Acorus calamus TaxID=4465 RepID=A0AAV9C6F9_ACOCL|nr:hypothetical protein QJS10_CPB21g01596 [Acorus calamus]